MRQGDVRVHVLGQVELDAADRASGATGKGREHVWLEEGRLGFVLIGGGVILVALGVVAGGGGRLEGPVAEGALRAGHGLSRGDVEGGIGDGVE